MSVILRHVVAAFRNPVTQAPSGSAFDRGQQVIPVPASGELYAIAIAADSEVSAVELRPNGRPEFAERIRITPDSPWIGRLDQEQLRVMELVAVPVIPADAIDGLTAVGECPMASYPRLKLDLYTESEPMSSPPKRLAPYQHSTHGTSAGGGASVELAFPVMGRERVGVQWLNTNHTGALVGLSISMTLQLLGYAVDAAGTIVPVTKSLAVATTPADTFGERWQVCEAGTGGGNTNPGWVLWTSARVTLAPGAAGTFDYRIIGGAW